MRERCTERGRFGRICGKAGELGARRAVITNVH